MPHSPEIHRTILPDGENLKVVSEQDTTFFIEENKKLYNDSSKGWTKSRDMRHVACIPNIIVEKWMNELGINALDKNDWPKVKKLLNSSEYLYLRTSPGRM